MTSLANNKIITSYTIEDTMIDNVPAIIIIETSAIGLNNVSGIFRINRRIF